MLRMKLIKPDTLLLLSAGIPINLIAYIGMPAAKSNSVSGLINFMRNIGSSIGTSMVTTLIARRAQAHQLYLVAHVTPGQSALSLASKALAARLAVSGMDASRAARRAYDRLYQALIGQATTIAYIDTFWVLASERESCSCYPSC